MEILKRIRQFVSFDNAGEDVANDLITLMRIISMILGVWYAFLAVFCFVQSIVNFGIMFAVTASFVVAHIALTFYTDDNTFLLSLFGIIVSVSSFLFARNVGWACEFQIFVLLYTLLIWYDSQKTRRIKSVMSIISVIVIVVTFGFCKGDCIDDVIVSMNTNSYAYIGMVNIAIFTLCMCLIAFSFSAQFLSTEHKLYQYNKKLKQMAGMDPLTQLLNRRAATEEINEIVDKYAANGESMSIAIGDIDFFKKVNDTYGHDAGDYVLKSLAMMFSETMKNDGFVARWGGEEFLFVFRSMNGDEASLVLNQLRSRIEKTEMVFNSVVFSVTMTFGLDEFSLSHGVEGTIKSADDKLYMGKEGGRNRVVF